MLIQYRELTSRTVQVGWRLNVSPWLLDHCFDENSEKSRNISTVIFFQFSRVLMFLSESHADQCEIVMVWYTTALVM